MTQDERPDSENTSAAGSPPAYVSQGRSGGDKVEPGEQPDEVVPDKGDDYQPDRSPDEVAPDQGDFDQPDSAPIESPPQPAVSPPETPALAH